MLFGLRIVELVIYHSVDDSSWLTVLIKKDTSYSMPTTYPTKGDFTFIGWSNDGDNTVEWVKDSTETKVCTDNTSWYAVWNKVITLNYIYIDSNMAIQNIVDSKDMNYPYNTTSTYQTFSIKQIPNSSFMSGVDTFNFAGFSYLCRWKELC
jgi:uncharacterized repeat protein (TIGR02543 family)